MVKQFTCPHCGKTHDGDPTDHSWTLPDEVWAIPEAERRQVAKFDTDLCKFGERYFIRSVLPIPFQDRNEYYGWGVWIEVEKSSFEAYLSVYEVDGSDEPRVLGWLANEIPGYDNPQPCPVELQFGPSDQRPMAYLPDDAKSQIAVEQRSGITAERYHEILEVTGTR